MRDYFSSDEVARDPSEHQDQTETTFCDWEEIVRVYNKQVPSFSASDVIQEIIKDKFKDYDSSRSGWGY